MSVSEARIVELYIEDQILGMFIDTEYELAICRVQSGSCIAFCYYTRLTLHGWPYSPIAGQSLDEWAFIGRAQKRQHDFRACVLDGPVGENNRLLIDKSQGIVEHKAAQGPAHSQCSFSEAKMMLYPHPSLQTPTTVKFFELCVSCRALTDSSMGKQAAKLPQKSVVIACDRSEEPPLAPFDGPVKKQNVEISLEKTALLAQGHPVLGRLY